METHLEGNILHEDEWSMSTTSHEFPLLSVLLRNLVVHSLCMTQLLIVHVPPFFYSCLSLSFQVKIHICLSHSDLNT